MDDRISICISFFFYIMTGIALYITASSSNVNRWTYKLVLLCTAAIVLWDLYLYEHGYTIQMSPLNASSTLFGTGICIGSLGSAWYFHLRKYGTDSSDLYVYYVISIGYAAFEAVVEIGSILIWSWAITGNPLLHISFPAIVLVFSILLGQMAPDLTEEAEDDD